MELHRERQTKVAGGLNSTTTTTTMTMTTMTTMMTMATTTTTTTTTIGSPVFLSYSYQHVERPACQLHKKNLPEPIHETHFVVPCVVVC